MEYVFAIILAVILIVRLIYVFGKGYSNKQLWLHFFYNVPTHVIDELDEGHGEGYQPISGKRSVSKNGVDIDSYPSFYGCNYDPAAPADHAVPQDEAHNDHLLRAGGWKCACGRVNAAYVSSCACGRNKHGETAPEPVRVEASEDDEIKNASAIREYKKLMDEGILTPEEFESKKKQLLGL